MSRNRIAFPVATAMCALALSFAPSALAQDGGVTDGGAAPVGLVAGDTCVLTDDQCGTGTVCASAFQGATAGACYNTCDTANAACTALSGQGACTQTAQNGPLFCLGVSALGDPCGDVVNTTCNPAETSLCLSITQGAPGFCAVVCTASNPTTCANAAQFGGAPGCGCTGTDVCSTNPLALDQARSEGVCSAANIDGGCGTNPNTGVIEVCTNGQQCAGLNDISGYGTCTGATVDPATPTPGANPADGGTPGPSTGEPSTPGPSTNEPGGRAEPEPAAGPDENVTDGCNSTNVPNTTVPAAFALIGLLGLALRRRR